MAKQPSCNKTLINKLVAALKAVRPEIVRQHDRCNSDEEVAPYAEKLRLIDDALTAASNAKTGE
jgi:hypothetical protein